MCVMCVRTRPDGVWERGAWGSLRPKQHPHQLQPSPLSPLSPPPTTTAAAAAASTNKNKQQQTTPQSPTHSTRMVGISPYPSTLVWCWQLAMEAPKYVGAARWRWHALRNPIRCAYVQPIASATSRMRSSVMTSLNETTVMLKGAANRRGANLRACVRARMHAFMYRDLVRTRVRLNNGTRGLSLIHI